MPPCFHKLLFLFFQHCYKQKQISASWKTSLTILLYKKGNPSQLTNHKPIALANIIYKFYTSTLTSILSVYGKKFQILHDSQEGFRAERSTSKPIQLLIATREDARLTNQDIYILYIDFKNTFGSINHARLLAIMKDLGYPIDSINLIENIYSQSSTIFIGNTSVKPYQYPFKEEQYKVIPLVHTYLSYSYNPSSGGYNKGIMDTHLKHLKLKSHQQQM